MDDNRVGISFEDGRRTVKGVGGRARIIGTGSTWIKIAGCLGIETDGDQIYYEDASERNTPERWKSLLQDRVFLRPEVSGSTVRDFACVIRQGRAGTRRIGSGIERLHTGQKAVRAFRFRTQKGTALAVVNFSTQSVSINISDQSIDVPEMDTVIIEG
jgi:hypothetical protein